MNTAAWLRNEVWESGRARETGIVSGMLVRPAAPEGKPPLRQVVLDSGEAFAELLGTSGGGRKLTLVSMHQVHGDAVIAVRSLDDLAAAKDLDPEDTTPFRMREFPEVDGLVTGLPNLVLLIKTADCLPILLWDPPSGAIGACHCGWRGTLAGLAAKTAREMFAVGAKPETTEAWIGPGVCASNYEVSPELLAQFQAAFPGINVSPGGRLLDLKSAARHQLRAAGLGEGRITDSGECTVANPRLHSYRRDGENAGRLLTLIGRIDSSGAPPA